MLEPSATKLQKFRHFVLRSLVIGSGLGSTALAGCGARSAIEVFDASPAGGASPRANPPDPALPVGGAGMMPAVGGAPMIPPSPPCESVTVAIDELRPAVTLVVDQSLSMHFGYPDKDSPVTRWALVGDALFDPTYGAVKRFEASVRFGIAFFTSNSRSGGVCPILSEVQAQTRNYAALDRLYRSLSPDGDTPTGDALQQVVTELQRIPSRGPRSILLVTDGNPDTCAQPNPDEGQPQAVAAVQRAFAAGIELYVLGISNDIAGHNLQQLANAGKGRRIDALWGVDADAAEPFQASGNVQGFSVQLYDILNRIPLCEVRLQRDVGLEEAISGRVLLDGQELTYSMFDGYALQDPRHLVIVGEACQALKDGGRQLSVRFSCD